MEVLGLVLEEVEILIILFIESVVNGILGVEMVWFFLVVGIFVVKVIFVDNIDIYWVR